MTKRTGILGGTFDPIHFGHLAIAEEARAALNLDRILLIPAAYQPLKDKQPAAGAQQRLEMVRLACADNPAFEPSDIELTRPGPSYTVTTLAALNESDLGDIYFIMGADALRDLPRWRQAASIPGLAHIVAVARPGYEIDQAALLRALPSLAGNVTLLPGPKLDIASSEIRERVAAQRPIRYLTPDPVVRYIAAHRLYL